MKDHKRHIVVFLYYSMADPLCSGLMLKYLKALRSNDTVFHLITHEQLRYAMTAQESSRLRESLAQEFNIEWTPMPYLSGRFFLLKKMISAVQSIRTIGKLKKTYPVDMIASMGTLAASFAFIAARRYKLEQCVFTYEPHSEIMMQAGQMSRMSVRYQISRWFENKIGLTAETVVCTTKHMQSELQQNGAKGQVLRLPTSVDESINVFNSERRAEIRASLGIEEKKVLIYPGKFGGMYAKQQTIQLIAAFLELEPNGHAIIITDYNTSEVSMWISHNGIGDRVTLLSTVPLETLSAYISASDIGLVAYADFDARKYCSPVKVGEYLLCGIPYIVQRGTSEDDEVAERENVGAVLETLDRKGLRTAWSNVEALLNEEKSMQRLRCRKVGIEYRGQQNAIALMRDIFKQNS